MWVGGMVCWMGGGGGGDKFIEVGQGGGEKDWLH